MPELLVVRSHQRKLSMIRLAGGGDKCSDRAGFGQYTLSTAKNSS